MKEAKKFLKGIAAAAAATVLVASTASAQIGVDNYGSPPPGGVGFTWYGGDVTFSGVSKDAWDRDHLYLFGTADFEAGGLATSLSGDLSGGVAASRFIGDNYTGTGCVSTEPDCRAVAVASLGFSKTFTVSQLLSILGTPGAGTELILGVYDINANVWNFTGSANRNTNIDGDHYFAATATIDATGKVRAGLEDLNKAALYDRNDLVLDITSAPEPATLALLATGLVGLAGVGAVRRRRKG